MAHCPFEKLNDLTDLFSELRKLPSLKEPKPGIFYLKSKGFLHFHTDGATRWADIRDGKDWGTKVDLPFKASQQIKKAFLKEAQARHARTLAHK